MFVQALLPTCSEYLRGEIDGTNEMNHHGKALVVNTSAEIVPVEYESISKFWHTFLYVQRRKKKTIQLSKCIGQIMKIVKTRKAICILCAKHYYHT